MGILDDALNLQGSKRSQRLSRAAQKEKIEANKIKEGTYRGIDLVDGTAMVQLDGQPNATNGYRLITNAPLGNGDRVSIRPNGVGLPRADAKNVEPSVEAVEDAINRIYAYVNLSINLLISPTVSGFYEFDATPEDRQKWNLQRNGDPRNFIRWETKPAPTWTTSDSGGVVVPIVPANVVFDYSVGEYIHLDINFGITFNISAFFFRIILTFDAAFTDLIADIPNEFPYQNGAPIPTSKIEIEFISSIGTLDRVELDLLSPTQWRLEAAVNCTGESIANISCDFRYRRRVTGGDPLPWFQL